MNRHKLVSLLVVLLFLPVAITPSALAGPEAPTVASPYISYQGYLQNSSGNPISGNVNLRFDIHSNSSCTGSVWNETQNSVPVTNGYFSVMLGSVTALTASVFSSATRYLQVQVNTGSGFTQVSCQQFGSVPYAFQAQEAAAAPWSGITSIPAGFSDNTDNDTTYTAGAGLTLIGTQFVTDTTFIQSRVNGSCPAGQSIRTVAQDGSVTCETDDNTTYTAGTGLSLVGTQFVTNTTFVQSRVNGACPAGSSISTVNQDGTVLCETDNGSYQNIIVVAQSGGDFTSIQAALDSITGTVTNRYLVYIAPGQYTEQVRMEPWVDIEGAGETATSIDYSPPPGVITGTLIGADNAEARFLTVKTSPGGAKAVAIYNLNASPRLTHVTALSLVTPTENIAVFNANGARPLMQSMTIKANSSLLGNNIGVYNMGAHPQIQDSNIEVSGYPDPTILFNTYGIYNVPDTGGIFSRPLVRNTSISVQFGFQAFGIFDQSSSTWLFTSIIDVFDGFSETTGFRVSLPAFSLSEIHNSTISVAGTISNISVNYGIRVDEGAAVRLDSSTVEVSYSDAKNNYGLHNFEAFANVYNSRINVANALQNVGVYGGGAGGTTYINSSSITTPGATGVQHPTLLQLGGHLINAGSTLLWGDNSAGAPPPLLQCVLVYDENYIPTVGVPALCP